MRPSAAHVMIRTGTLEKRRDALVERRWLRRRVAKRQFECVPPWKAILERECVLHVAQGRDRGGIRKCSRKASAGIGVTREKRLQPALRLLLEALQAAPGRELSAHWKPSSEYAPEVR